MEDDFLFENSRTLFDKVLDIFVFIGVFVVIIFFILEMLVIFTNIGISIEEINNIYFPIGIVILCIFVIDLYRLYKQSSDYIEFVKKNYLDILATIPFGLLISGPLIEILKVFRLPKLLKFLRVGKIAKTFKAASHLKKKSENEDKIRL